MNNKAYMQMLKLIVPIKDYQRFEEGYVEDLDETIKLISEKHNQPEIYNVFQSARIFACITEDEIYGQCIITKLDPIIKTQTVYSLIEESGDELTNIYELIHEEVHGVHFFKGDYLLEKIIKKSGWKLKGSLLVLGEEDEANLVASWNFLNDGWTKKQIMSKFSLPNPNCLNFIYRN